jgi:hypothetical protein
VMSNGDFYLAQTHANRVGASKICCAEITGYHAIAILTILTSYR